MTPPPPQPALICVATNICKPETEATTTTTTSDNRHFSEMSQDDEQDGDAEDEDHHHHHHQHKQQLAQALEDEEIKKEEIFIKLCHQNNNNNNNNRSPTPPTPLFNARHRRQPSMGGQPIWLANSTCCSWPQKQQIFMSSIVLYLLLLISCVIDLNRGVEALKINIITRPLEATSNQTNLTLTSQHKQQHRLHSKRSTNEMEALHYLQRFGYMNESTSGASSTGGASQLIAEESFHEAVMSFQRFAGLTETGSLDDQTMKFMQMPRCGNKDLSGRQESGRRKRKKRKKRRKRYALQGSKWRRQELTYRISQYPSRFQHKKHEVDQQIDKAFRVWSQVAPIDFVAKREGRVHIDIRFAGGEHGDGDPFDGPGNTLAHAYFPQYGGDAHFDDQEYWTVDSYTGTNIFQVAAHELGHSLGLGHSSVRDALMAPFYQKYKPNFKLHADDVLAIQALYGERNNGGANDNDDDDDDDNEGDNPNRTPSRTTSTTTTTTTTTPSSSDRTPKTTPKPDYGGEDIFSQRNKPPVDLCQDGKIDAITRVEDGTTYVFRGQHYWQVKNEGLASGPPGRISLDWDGLPGNLDAALTWSDGKTFFFKGDKYWRYQNKKRVPGYPKLISAGFAGIPNNIDAAFLWSGNGKTYFFKRDKYWRFDSKQEPPVSSQYPKPLRNWAGLPANGIDAAFRWDNGMSYFFKGDQYYRFDDRQFEVDSSAHPSFPRSTPEWWFGCTNSNLPLLDSSASSLSPSGLPTPGGRTSRNSSGGGGSSSSSSLFSSLSSLFGLNTQTAANNNNKHEHEANSLDWSFHRGGLPEEARRLTHKQVGAAIRRAADIIAASRP